MKKLFVIVFLFMVAGCSKGESIGNDTSAVNDFIWKGMNTYYLWQESVPNLSDSKNDNASAYQAYLNSYADPDAFFESLIYERNTVDKWSWIVDDYIALEQYFSGVRKTTGAVIKFYYKNTTTTDLFGVVRYVVPNTDAANKGVQRGFVFDKVNGTYLNVSNYANIFNGVSDVNIEWGTYSYDNINESVVITLNGNNTTLVYGQYNQNPIYTYNVQNHNGQKIGYLMYTSFVSNYDAELNQVFQYFKDQNITGLILDLRYNGGGAVSSAINLSSMITGQFTGQLYTKEVWNSKIQAWLQSDHPEWISNYFMSTLADGSLINSLQLNQLVVLTTGDSASASELVINALKPYIQVTTIGTKTHGKYVASVTLYDSPNFSRTNANPNHHWAIQPIVLKEVNKAGSYSATGFEPDILIYENQGAMGVLGTTSEPYYNRAVQYITTGTKSPANTKKTWDVPENLFERNEMYVDKNFDVFTRK
jgi:C-terminal processing protease CtpA/Prc